MALHEWLTTAMNRSVEKMYFRHSEDQRSSDVLPYQNTLKAFKKDQHYILGGCQKGIAISFIWKWGYTLSSSVKEV